MEEHHETEQAIHISDYILVLRKHKWLIVFTLILIVTLVTVYTVRMEPVYRASSTMVIEQSQTTSPLTGERMDFESFSSQTLTFNTHFKLITSVPVIERVIQDLSLDRPDKTKDMEISFFQQFVSQIKKNLRNIMGWHAPVMTLEEKHSLLVEKLKKKINIEQVRDTRLLKIGVDDRDPDQARQIANSLAKAYIEFNLSNRMTSERSTLQWMKDQAYTLKKQLEDAELEFLAYKQSEMLFSLEGKQQMIAQKILDVNDSYLDTRRRRHELEAQLAELRKSLDESADVVSVQSILESTLINNLYSQLIEMETELSSISKVLRDRHPEVVRLKSNIENTRTNIREQISKKINDMESQRAVMLAKERNMAKDLEDYEKEALETSQRELQYKILARNVTTNQNLYDILLTKLKEADVTHEADLSNIRIAETASKPISPVKPNKKRNLLLSIVIGLMAGFGLAFLNEYMDRTLHTEEDVQNTLGYPVLAVVPLGEPVKMDDETEKV